MSNDPKTTESINIANPAEETPEETVVETQTRRQRALASIKKHKTTLIAGTGLVVAMGVSAALGRASAPAHDPSEPLQLESGDTIDIEVVESQTIEID